MRRRALLLTLAVLPAYADDALQRCAGLTDDAARLSCYDALAGRAQAGIPAKTGDDDFGSEQLHHPQDAAATATLHSRIPGDFSGWEAKTRFVLENGQVWQNVGDGSVYFRAHDPAVTIEKGAFGGYWLRVEGLSVQTRVRRIR